MDDSELEYETIFSVIDSWEQLRRVKDYQNVAGSCLFVKLFEKCPPAKVLFGFPIDMDPQSEEVGKSKRFQTHSRYMIQMLDRALGLLGPDEELLLEILERLGKTHARIGVHPQYFPFMEEALLETLQECLGSNSFTPELEHNWKLVYAVLSGNIIKAMNGEQLVLESWAKLSKMENYEEEAGKLLFQEMFRQCPESKTLFGFPIDMDIDSDAILRSRRFKTHSKYFIEMLDRALKMVKAQEMDQHMKQLGELHAEFGVKPEFFPIMGDALFMTLKTLLEEDWNDDLKGAWGDFYGRLSSQMIAAIKASKNTKQ
ncbi:symbiotic hemoglobin [Seminavis robusta]|uniref:Symbiotic hemoglobin n=1 Tax=Seminavis robusta TaxID=568900 RepID=A0A9N8HPK5_9STRA|nr:symbiotic hemoglobin [Seminavis robusta]|eukprot:Sro1078_g238710.1 symbiotic hemoglobin (314) ;mRNA; r:1158-2193